MGDAVDTFTTEGLIELLADAGEVDAGVEVLEAVRAHDPASSQTIRLQARLFDAEAPAPERRRSALLTLRDGRVDTLARHGALLEACVALRLLNREFPDEPMWADKLSRLEDLLQPLPNLHGDVRRADVDALIALGRTREAWELLREMVADAPGELELARRADALRALLFAPVHTRPYRDEGVEAAPTTPDDEAEPDADEIDEPTPRSEDPDVVLVLAEQDVAVGDLRGALCRLALVSPTRTDASRWVRYRDALIELVAVLDDDDSFSGGSGEEETARLGLTELIDLKIRAGALREAREQAMARLAEHPDTTESSVLTRRITALDELLGGPTPAAPVAATPLPDAPALEVEIVRDPPRASLPPPDGVVQVKHRRIVRLG